MLYNGMLSIFQLARMSVSRLIIFTSERPYKKRFSLSSFRQRFNVLLIRCCAIGICCTAVSGNVQSASITHYWRATEGPIVALSREGICEIVKHNVGDLGARCLWRHFTDYLFDLRVKPIDNFVPYYQSSVSPVRCNHLYHPICSPAPTATRAQGAPQSCPSVEDHKGNPISISSGNKFQVEFLLGGYLPLQLSYNSTDQVWRHTYDYRLSISGSDASLIRPDGKGFTFSQIDGIWGAVDADVYYRLEAVENGASAWRVITPSGVSEHYDAQGKILSIESLQGEMLVFSHTDTETTVTDQFDNELILGISNEKLVSATLNGSLQASLEYDAQERLVTRTDAANQTIEYHYEDTNFPNHLTGITGADGQRFASWAYDSEGRGILSEHAGQERYTFTFNSDDSTTVTNPLGKQTTYHYQEIQGLKRPVQIEGHASDNCVAANRAYSYHDNGLLQSKTDWKGQVTAYEYNDRGLITRVIEAQGTVNEKVTEHLWHQTLPLLLEKRETQAVTHYEYSADNLLSGSRISPR